MRWFRRRSAPWIVLTLQATGGSFAAGLLAAAWMLYRQSHDPVPCFMDLCESHIAIDAVIVAGSYFLASAGIAVAVGASEVTGEAQAGLRSVLAVLGPPLLWLVAMVGLL
jgi:4-hydroxybenzoate polyprenyltransferase